MPWKAAPSTNLINLISQATTGSDVEIYRPPGSPVAVALSEWVPTDSVLVIVPLAPHVGVLVK